MTEILEQEFFAPASTDMVDAVIGRYREERAKIEHVCQFLHGDGLASVVHYFMDGNRDSRDRFTGSVEKVLEAIGGIRCQGAHRLWYEFDYDPDPVIKTIIVSGCVPDHKSHQYYPTPKGLAARVVELADIGETGACLEPSAGTGAIADLLPKERTTCIEVSPLHASVLAQKGHTVHEGDFLTFAEGHPNIFDRIVMNPPFSQGRWKAHVEAAASLLSPGGKLVAVIPSSAHGSYRVEGLNVVYDGPHDNQFSGTSTSVTILIGEKA